jgi:hypothetical protein
MNKHSKTNDPAKRLEREMEKDRYTEEIMLAHAFIQACPELSYGEALRHAYAKLRREGKR